MFIIRYVLKAVCVISLLAFAVYIFCSLENISNY